MPRLLHLLLASIVSSASAQQPEPSVPRPRPIWSVGGELSLTELTGNRALTLITSGFSVKRVSADGAVVEAITGMRYGTSNGTVASENYRAEASARLRPHGRVSPSFRATAARDPIKSLDLRLSVAVGVDIALLSGGPGELQLGAALLQDREYRHLPPESDLERRSSFTRFDIRLRARVPLREAVTLEHQTVMQPVADNLADYLLTTRSALQVFVTRQLALQTSYLLERDATPLPTVEFKNDRTLTVGILLRFTTAP